MPIAFRILPLTADLAATPSSLQAGVLKGTQQFVAFTVTNNGSVASGNIAVSLPVNAPSWLTVASGAMIPSLGPGGTATVTLQLLPDASLLPVQISGDLALNAAGGASLSVPFAIHVTLDATGSLAGTVVDEMVANGTSGVQLSGATITLSDPDTDQVVATTTTDANGGFSFANIVEGTYELNASAAGHLPVQQAVVIMAGIANTITDAQGNVQPIFLPLAMVTYQWAVVPTQIQDNYKIVLQDKFLTNVPAPNVIVDKTLICPLLHVGGSTEIDLNLTNEGLVRTTDLYWVIQPNPYYTITPEVANLPVLPGQSEEVSRLLITPNPADAPGYLPLTCPLTITLLYDYDADGEHTRRDDVKVYPFLVSAAAYQQIGADWAGRTPPLFVEQQDLFSASAAFVNTVMTDAELRTSTSRPRSKRSWRCAPDGITGSQTEVMNRFFEMFNDFCSLTVPPAIIGGGDGGGGGGVIPTMPPIPLWPSSPGEFPGVTVETDQSSVLTGDAFKATLEIDNSSSSPLTDIQVTLDIRQHVPPNGGSLEANDDFFVCAARAWPGDWWPDGGGRHGHAGCRPFRDPAVHAHPHPGRGHRRPHRISHQRHAARCRANRNRRRTSAGRDGGSAALPGGDPRFSRPVAAGELLPATRRSWRRPLHAASRAFPALRPGRAGDEHRQRRGKELSLISAQPKIVENRSGLVNNFTIIAAQVGNQQTKVGSLTAAFGDIAPGKTATADFQMISALQGEFDSYYAEFSHDDALGGRETSRIDSVSVHNLIHSVQVGYVNNPANAPIPDDGIRDFLVDDYSADNVPDTLYLSDGTKSAVNEASDPVLRQVDPQTWTLIESAPSGWSYVEFPDPTGGRLVLNSVTRSDGPQLRVGDNVWTTDRTFNSDGTCIAENLVHMLDYNAGTTIYTLHFTTNTVRADDRVDRIRQAGHDEPAAGHAGGHLLQADRRDDLRLPWLRLTYNGGTTNLINGPGAVEILAVSDQEYRISGLDELQLADGVYTLMVDADGVMDFAGNSGHGTVGTTWTLDTIDTTVTVEDVTTPRTRRPPA